MQHNTTNDTKARKQANTQASKKERMRGHTRRKKGENSQALVAT